MHFKNMKVNFLWQKWNPNANTKWKTKHWLQILELLITTFLTPSLSWKKRKENKTNYANIWHTTINIHFDINSLAKGNLANTQQRIKVILDQQKFTTSFLSWTFTILFFLISHKLFHTLFKKVWREYMYLFLTPSLNLP